MALNERDWYRYGDTQKDIRDELAVYARDGTEWLEFTIAGWNADVGNGTLEDAENFIEKQERLEGCGCSGTGMVGAWWVVGLIGLAGRRRRS